MEGKFMDAMHKGFKAFDDKNTGRFQSLEDKLNELQAKHDLLQADVNSNRTKVASNLEQLGKGLVVASNTVPTPQTRSANNFERAVDVTVIKINTASEVGKEDIMDIIVPWLAQCHLSPDQVDLTGQAVSKFFTLQFKGARGLAAERVTDALKGLWVDGKRQDFVVTSPTNKQIKVFIGPDKNAKTIKQETSSARLMHNIKAVHPERHVHVDRNQAKVFIDWIPAVQVVATGPTDPVQLVWNKHPAVAELHIKKDEVETVFFTDARSNTNVGWV